MNTNNLTQATVGVGSRGHAPPTDRGRWVSSLAVAWWLAGTVVALVSAAALLRPGSAAPPDSLTSGLLRSVPGADLVGGLAALGLVGSVVAVWIRSRRQASSGARTAALIVAAAVVAGAVLVVDSEILTRMGYLPALIVVSIASGEWERYFGGFLTPQFLSQVALLGGAALLATSAVRFARRTAAACEACGRRHRGPDPAWTTPAAAARWGRVAALVAASVPLVYAVTRFAWALGIPLGFSRAYLEQLAADGAVVAEVGLGGFAVVGAVLTLGLYQRWGEVFPRWMPGLAGKPVPVRLAVVPAAVVAAAVLPAGLGLIAGGLAGEPVPIGPDTWGAIAPIFLWPLWSVALGAATYAYWLRRRGRCAACGRGRSE